jgi:hypothetical protein
MRSAAVAVSPALVGFRRDGGMSHDRSGNEDAKQGFAAAPSVERGDYPLGRLGDQPGALSAASGFEPASSSRSSTISFRICTRNNPAFRSEVGTESGVGPVSPCRTDVLRRHFERRWFIMDIRTALIS